MLDTSVMLTLGLIGVHRLRVAGLMIQKKRDEERKEAENELSRMQKSEKVS